MATPSEYKKSYMMQFFQFGHLHRSMGSDLHRADLKAVSKMFDDLAVEVDKQLPSNPEKTTALRKLLEAKDCAVRAVLFENER